MQAVGLSRNLIKLPHAVIVRAPGLLPMLYTCRELAEELELPDSTLRDWLAAGAPHTRDDRQHIWINGEDFGAWVKAQRQPRTRQKLLEDEAYCLHCKGVIKLVSPVPQLIKGKLTHPRGQCPACGHTIIRGGRYDRTHQLSQGQSPSELSAGCAPSRP
jgi:hypothetical protein